MSKPALYIKEDTLLHGNGGDTFWDTEVSWWQEDGFVPLYAHPSDIEQKYEELKKAYDIDVKILMKRLEREISRNQNKKE